MAEFSSNSNRKRSAHEMDSSVQIPSNQRDGRNLLPNQSEGVGNMDENKTNLLEEKLQIEEKINGLKSTISIQIREYRKLTAIKLPQEKAFFASDEDAPSIAEKIKSRLLVAYSSNKAIEIAFESYLDCSRKCLKIAYSLNADNKAILQRKLTLFETKFSLFKEQLTKIETLLKPDYDILCQESSECFTVVMTECNKLDDHFYEITSLIFED